MPSPTNIRYWKKKAILFGMESSYGVDPTLVGTDWFEARNVTLTPFEATTADRAIVQPYMGNGGNAPTWPSAPKPNKRGCSMPGK